LASGTQHFPRNSNLDQLSRPFSFLSNIGGRETNQATFTTNIDKKLLDVKKQAASVIEKTAVMADSTLITNKESARGKESSAGGKIIIPRTDIEEPNDP
jgi:hypothetical protein